VFGAQKFISIPDDPGLSFDGHLGCSVCKVMS
jgi:hypothetical protein